MPDAVLHFLVAAAGGGTAYLAYLGVKRRRRRRRRRIIIEIRGDATKLKRALSAAADAVDRLAGK